jgi:hypothetical protein
MSAFRISGFNLRRTLWVVLENDSSDHQDNIHIALDLEFELGLM